jgi:uncharacterized protein
MYTSKHLKGGEENMRIEIRNDSILVQGYVNAVGRESRILASPKGRFKEQIVPKTFEKALLKGRNVDLLFNHNKNKKLGSVAEGNLELREDNIGLWASATITDPEVMEKGRSGALKGWSFAFACNKDSWSEGSDGISRRMVEDLDLFEVSVLDQTPAYIGTSLEARGEESVICEQRTEEDNNQMLEDKSTAIEDDKKVEERTTIEPFYYSNLQEELSILTMKGSLNK